MCVSQLDDTHSYAFLSIKPIRISNEWADVICLRRVSTLINYPSVQFLRTVFLKSTAVDLIVFTIDICVEPIQLKRLPVASSIFFNYRFEISFGCCRTSGHNPEHFRPQCSEQTCMSTQWIGRVSTVNEFIERSLHRTHRMNGNAARLLSNHLDAWSLPVKLFFLVETSEASNFHCHLHDRWEHPLPNVSA